MRSNSTGEIRGAGNTAFNSLPPPDLRGLALVVVAVAWLVGIWISSWVLLPAWILLLGAGAALVGVILLWRGNWGWLILLAAFWLLLGAWRYTTVSPVGDPQAISAFIGSGKVEVNGTVADEPTLGERSTLLVISVSAISTNGGSTWQDAHGQMEVVTLGELLDNPYGARYGDSVELQGKLQKAPPHSLPSIFASMAFPRITVNNTGGNPIIAALFHLRSVLAALISQSLPQPEAALLIAILLGLRTPALQPLASFFNETGTAHLIAPSGFKVTLLAGLVMASTRWLYEKPSAQRTRMLPAQKLRGKRRWLASALVITSIAVYTILNGAGPAALRAGIMGILLVTAPRLGRIYNIYTALATAALLMTIFDPFVLWDAGFQLSFLGTIGIVVLTPLLQRLLKPIERLPFGHFINEIIAVTLAAQIATLPISALTFDEVSFVAPIANILTMPLLEPLILTGILLCVVGLISAPLALVCGWVTWPILWYLINVIKWCASLPGAYINVTNVNSGLVWLYYGLIPHPIRFVLYRWPTHKQSQQGDVRVPTLLSRRGWRILQLSAALLIILATGATVLAARPDGRLTITFLNVGPANQPAQGEAILIHTADGKTALIDGGLDATSLGQELDSRLPFWQRSLDFVLLTSPGADHLDGLQDVITRYQVGEVLDAGMLHPSSGYALWRRTIAERNLHYVQVRQGTTLALGSQVTLQVFWPPSLLHKGSSEEMDNGLVVRLIAPGLRMLLLGAAALSKYALAGILTSISPSYLQADIVQVVLDVGKSFPSQLKTVLQAAKPSSVVVTPAALSAKQRKAGATSTIASLSQLLPAGPWQAVQTAQLGSIEISSSNLGWAMNVSE